MASREIRATPKSLCGCKGTKIDFYLSFCSLFVFVYVSWAGLRVSVSALKRDWRGVKCARGKYPNRFPFASCHLICFIRIDALPLSVAGCFHSTSINTNGCTKRPKRIFHFIFKLNFFDERPNQRTEKMPKNYLLRTARDVVPTGCQHASPAPAPAPALARRSFIPPMHRHNYKICRVCVCVCGKWAKFNDFSWDAQPSGADKNKVKRSRRKIGVCTRWR